MKQKIREKISRKIQTLQQPINTTKNNTTHNNNRQLMQAATVGRITRSKNKRFSTSLTLSPLDSKLIRPHKRVKYDKKNNNTAKTVAPSQEKKQDKDDTKIKKTDSRPLQQQQQQQQLDTKTNTNTQSSFYVSNQWVQPRHQWVQPQQQQYSPDVLELLDACASKRKELLEKQSQMQQQQQQQKEQQSVHRLLHLLNNQTITAQKPKSLHDFVVCMECIQDADKIVDVDATDHTKSRTMKERNWEILLQSLLDKMCQ